MKTTAFVPVEQYLRSVYKPDCDYVDGEVQERAVAQRDHSELQGELLFFFRTRRQQWNVRVYAEQRVQISPTRFRVPDLCVYAGERPLDQVFRTPPFICIEILSPEDRAKRIQSRIDDFLNFGVAYVWVIDPTTRRDWIHTKDGIREGKGVLRTGNPSFEVPLAEIFAGIDENRNPAPTP